MKRFPLNGLFVFLLLTTAGFAESYLFTKTQKNARAGDAKAQFQLGMMYRNGDGVTKDSVEAAYWFRTAAEKGYVDAQHELARMCIFGDGVPKDIGEGIKWITKAAEQGYWPAQRNLGWMYANGEGVPKDFVQAYVWFSAASAQGNELAIKYKELVERSMTSEQKAQAVKLNRELLERLPKK